MPVPRETFSFGGAANFAYAIGMVLSVLLMACATGAPLGARLQPFERSPYIRAGIANESNESLSGEADDTPSLVTSVPQSRQKVMKVAQALVGHTKVVLSGKRYGDDCTGLVRAVYAQVGIDLMTQGRAGDNGVTAIWRYASSHGQAYTGGRPVPGDLVFFKETYDLNRDGRDNDGLTHIGLVEAVDDDQTVTVIHRIKKGVVRYRMNLTEPDKSVDALGRLINDKLRPPRAKAKAMLTSQLFSSYVNLLPVEPNLVSKRGGDDSLSKSLAVVSADQ